MAMDKRRRNDLLLIGGVLATALIGLVLYLALRVPGTTAVVLIDGKEVTRYPLDTPAQMTIQLEEQSNELVIRDGKAFITEANCPDRICVKHRGISHVGETIVCLPHKVVVRIEGGYSADLDTPDITA